MSKKKKKEAIRINLIRLEKTLTWDPRGAAPVHTNQTTWSHNTPGTYWPDLWSQLNFNPITCSLNVMPQVLIFCSTINLWPLISDSSRLPRHCLWNTPEWVHEYILWSECTYIPLWPRLNSSLRRLLSDKPHRTGTRSSSWRFALFNWRNREGLMKYAETSHLQSTKYTCRSCELVPK